MCVAVPDALRRTWSRDEPFLVVDGGEYEEFRKRFDATGQRASQRPTLLAITGDARVYGFP